VDNAGTPGVAHVVLSYAYDLADRVTSLTEKVGSLAGATTGYAYDADGRVINITQTGGGGSDKRVDLGYDPASRLVTVNRFTDLAGTVFAATSNIHYDAADRVTKIHHTQGATTLAQYLLDYDAADRLTHVDSAADGKADFTYDTANQLTGALFTGQPSESYSYGSNGNRSGTGITVGSDNELMSDGKFDYTYDNEGNLTSQTEIATGKVTQYSWDYHNRLTGVVVKDSSGAVVQTSAYTYDVLGQRIGKSVTTGAGPAVVERYIRDGDNLLLTLAAGKVVTHRYLDNPQTGQVLADDTTTGIAWPLADELGTVRDVVDSSGTSLDHVRYTAFGAVVSTVGPGPGFHFGYTGSEYDSETGLVYDQARYYDPATGRFLSQDPSGFSAGDPNLYRYVGNDVTNRIDPSGLEEVDPSHTGIAGSIRGAVSSIVQGVRKAAFLGEGESNNGPSGGGAVSATAQKFRSTCPDDQLWYMFTDLPNSIANSVGAWWSQVTAKVVAGDDYAATKMIAQPFADLLGQVVVGEIGGKLAGVLFKGGAKAAGWVAKMVTSIGRGTEAIEEAEGVAGAVRAAADDAAATASRQVDRVAQGAVRDAEAEAGTVSRGSEEAAGGAKTAEPPTPPSEEPPVPSEEPPQPVEGEPPPEPVEGEPPRQPVEGEPPPVEGERAPGEGEPPANREAAGEAGTTTGESEGATAQGEARGAASAVGGEAESGVGTSGRAGDKLDPFKACFAAGTQVVLAPASPNNFQAERAHQRTRAIEQLAVGDFVLARDERTGTVGWQPVRELLRRTTDHLRLLRVRSQDGEHLQEIKTTDWHVVWAVGRGWLMAAELSVGDLMLQPDGGWATVEGSARVPYPEGLEVYNIEVAEYHTYFVAAQGSLAPPVWVHNDDCAKKVEELLSRNQKIRTVEFQPARARPISTEDLELAGQRRIRVREAFGGLNAPEYSGRVNDRGLHIRTRTLFEHLPTDYPENIVAGHVWANAEQELIDAQIRVWVENGEHVLVKPTVYVTPGTRIGQALRYQVVKNGELVIDRLLNLETGAAKTTKAFIKSGGKWLAGVQIGTSTEGGLGDPTALSVILRDVIARWQGDLPGAALPHIQLVIADLPTGELGEAVIDAVGPDGLPTAGTILLSPNAAGVGWFVDHNPLDNSEFADLFGPDDFQAPTGSPAAGKYDLVTAIEHELGHLLGVNPDLSGFDRFTVGTISGSQLFVGPGFIAALTADRSELDPQMYPHDLMAETLAPSERRLPSDLDVQIIDAVRNAPPVAAAATVITPPAHPVAVPLFGATDPPWSTRGFASAAGNQLTLQEHPRVLTGLSRTFAVPQNPKTLVFTITRAAFGANGPNDPPDAFEAALLDAASMAPLAGTAVGLTNTDSLFNIQSDGEVFFSPQVAVSGLSASGQVGGLDRPMTVTVDIHSLTPGTQATLYFDLLGFGPTTSSVSLVMGTPPPAPQQPLPTPPPPLPPSPPPPRVHHQAPGEGEGGSGTTTQTQNEGLVVTVLEAEAAQEPAAITRAAGSTTAGSPTESVPFLESATATVAGFEESAAAGLVIEVSTGQGPINNGPAGPVFHGDILRGVGQGEMGQDAADPFWMWLAEPGQVGPGARPRRRAGNAGRSEEHDDFWPWLAPTAPRTNAPPPRPAPATEAFPEPPAPTIESIDVTFAEDNVRAQSVSDEALDPSLTLAPLTPANRARTTEGQAALAATMAWAGMLATLDGWRKARADDPVRRRPTLSR
jgi:RHS repeat-associated protein